MEITQKLATRTTVPIARNAFVRAPTPFHSPSITPIIVEKKIVEAINVNGDIQTKEWQAIKEKLDAIKTNTKTMTRKGYEP